MRCRGEAHTTQTAHRQRWRAGGGFHNSAAAGMCRRRLSWQGAPVHPSSALPCSPHIVLPGRQVGGGAPQQLQIMGSLPHGVSPGISLSLGDDWCGQVHREHWRLGLWREASPAYFSAQPLGPKLLTPVAEQHRSTIALAGSPSQKKVSVETSGSWRPEHQFQFLLIIHSKCVPVTNRPKLLSGSSHLSSFSCARLLRMFERSGCGRGNTKSSMLDILIKLLTLFS